MENPHQGHRKRLKERAIKGGMDSFASHEVLELMLSFAIARKDTNQLAHELLNHFGSLSRVFDATFEELSHISGIGENSAALLTLLPDVFAFYQRDLQGKKPQITSFLGACEYCKTLFTSDVDEQFYIVCLNAGGFVESAVLVASGSIDSVEIEPRKVMQAVLRFNAHSVVIAHNHPSGTMAASPCDIHATDKIVSLLSSVGIMVLDHLIIGKGDAFSMRREKLINVEVADNKMREPKMNYRV